jgi:ribosomal protein L16 Arg81 hydroxylase
MVKSYIRMVYMTETKGYVPVRPLVVNEGGVHILPPLKKEEIEKLPSSEDLTGRVMEERKVPPEALENMQRLADQYDLNRSL